MRFLDQRSDAPRAFLARQPRTDFPHEGRRDLVAASLGGDREPIDVAPPSVPSADYGTDDVSAGVCCDQHDRLPLIDDALHFFQCIGNAWSGVRTLPKLQKLDAIGARAKPQSNRIVHDPPIIRMRTSIAIALSVALLFTSLNGPPVAIAVDMDGVIMQNEKMLMMKAGKAAGPMTSDLTMVNGTKVSTAGLMIMRDGKKLEMKDGEMMMMDGKIMQGGKATGMANQ
jgi:hypothetical protein